MICRNLPPPPGIICGLGFPDNGSMLDPDGRLGDVNDFWDPDRALSGASDFVGDEVDVEAELFAAVCFLTLVS